MLSCGVLQIFGVSGPPQQVQRRRWMRHCVNRRLVTSMIAEPDTGRVRRHHAQHSRRTVRVLHRFGHLGLGSHPACRGPHPAHSSHRTSSRGLHRRRTVDASSTTRRRWTRPVAQRDTPRPHRPPRRRHRSALSANTTTLKSSQPPRRVRSRRPGSGGGHSQRQTRSRTRCPYHCTRHGDGHASKFSRQRRKPTHPVAASHLLHMHRAGGSSPRALVHARKVEGTNPVLAACLAIVRGSLVQTAGWAVAVIRCWQLNGRFVSRGWYAPHQDAHHRMSLRPAWLV